MARALPVRPDLASVEPYLSPQLPARYRMNTNECPYLPPAPVLAAVRDVAAGGLNRYPSRDAGELMEALSAHTGRAVEHLAAANGSNEVLLQIFLAYGGPGDPSSRSSRPIRYTP